MKKYFNEISNIYIAFILIGIVALLHIDIVLAPINEYICSFETMDLKYYLGLRTYAFNCIKNGFIPLWITKLFCGIPFLANPETAIFYLPNILFFFVPISKAINFSFLLHFFILSFSVFLWINNKVKNKLISIIVAVIAIFNSSFYLHFYAAHLSNVITMAWFPLLLYFYDRSFKTKSYFYILPISLVISLQIFAGHIQYTYYSALISLIYVIFFCRNKKVFVITFLSYLIALILTSVQFLPTVDFYFEGGRRIGLSNMPTVLILLKPIYLLTLFIPEKIPYTHNLFWETSNYIGALNFFVVLLALFHTRNKQILKLFLIASVLYLFAFYPFSKIAENIIPFFHCFRGYVKLTFFANILLLPILAYGIRFILLRRTKVNLFFILSILIISILIMLFREKIFLLITYENMNSICDSLKMLSFLFLFFSVLLLLKKHFIFTEVIIFLLIMEPIVLMRLYAKPIILKNNNKYTFVTNKSFNRQPRFHVYDIQNLNSDAENISGSYPDKLKNYLSFYNKKRNDNIWGILRCKYILSSGNKIIHTFRERNLNKLNVFFNYEIEPDKERTYKKLYNEYFDIFDTVVLEKEPTFKPQTKGDYDINILSCNGNSMDFEVTTTEPAIILYADNYTKDWKAYNIDNPKQKYEIICADYIYKAISVDKGHHKIRFEYKPISFIIGMWVSITSWIIFTFFWIFIYIRKRKNKVHCAS